jgi:hypothetical protein
MVSLWGDSPFRVNFSVAIFFSSICVFGCPRPHKLPAIEMQAKYARSRHKSYFFCPILVFFLSMVLIPLGTTVYSITSRWSLSDYGLIHKNPGPTLEISSTDELAHRKGLAITYLNARHLPGKIARLRELLDDMGPSILHISETWLGSDIDSQLLKINGYKFYRFDRAGAHRSKSMALYIPNNITHTKPCCFRELDFTLIHTTIAYQKMQYVTVGIYRPDQGASVYKQNRFIDRFSDIIRSINTTHPIICKGDINFDIYPTPLPARSRRVLSVFEELGLDQQILNPTRVTSSSRTLIDWVCCNPLEFKHEHHNINFETHTGGDHQCVGIFLLKSFGADPKHKHTYINNSDFSKYNSMQMRNLLRTVNWRDVEYQTTLNDKYNLFEKKVIDLLILCSPMVKTRTCFCPAEPTKATNKPWYTQFHHALKTEVKRQHQAVRAALNTDMYHSAHRNYRDAINRYTTQCQIASRNFNLSQIRNAEQHHNARTTNKLVKTLMGKNKHRSTIDKIVSDGVTITEHLAISNALNNYFSTIGAASSRTASNILLQHLVTDKVAPNLSFIPPGFIETHKRLLSVNLNKPPGPGGVPGRFFREFADELVYIIEHIFAHCIYTSTIPDKWKLSFVTPIFKNKGTESDPYNYRPIGITSVISKIFERYICDRLVDHLESNKLLSDTQFGYRKGRSTLHALTHLTDTIRRLSDSRSNSLVGALFLDLSKAFDCVSHSLLIKMLPLYGLDHHAVALMESFLVGRVQKVKLSQTTISDAVEMTCGVPQGSLLGPILFDLYINTLSQQVEGTVSQYADDTALIRNAETIDQLKSLLQSDLQSLITYFGNLGLLLNVGKTDYLLFGFNGPGEDAQIVLPHSPPINPSNEVTYLGVIIDNKLNFNAQNKAVLQKLKFSTYTIRKLRPHLTEQSAKMLLNQQFYSYSDYCSIVWTQHANSYHCERLEVQHRAALKVVLKKKRRTRSAQLYSLSGALTLFQRFRQAAAKFTRTILYMEGPWLDFFTRSETPRGRAELRLITPICIRNTIFTRETINWRLSQIWNSLPVIIRTANKHLFVASLKEHLKLATQTDIRGHTV